MSRYFKPLLCVWVCALCHLSKLSSWSYIVANSIIVLHIVLFHVHVWWAYSSQYSLVDKPECKILFAKVVPVTKIPVVN